MDGWRLFLFYPQACWDDEKEKREKQDWVDL